VSEHAGKPIVRSWGLPVAQGILAEDVDGALAAARTIGDPVVAKVSALALAHKSELGLVEIGIADDHAMAIVAERLLRLAGAGGVVAGPIDGILVEPMIADALEMVVGVIHDPDVGPVIMIGAGGT
jgi:acyl-CoA synthetase (NDP forming)